MRVLFAGTPQLAVESLRALAASRHEVVGVLTAPDRRRGRGSALAPSPVKAAASELAIPVLQPERLNGEARAEVAALAPDLLACFAYGKIFGPRFLALFERGGLNIHPSLLPRFRGPAPIPAAILAGDDVTGVTIQQLALEMDAGDIVAQERIVLSGDETSDTLAERVSPVAASLLVRVIDGMEAGTVVPVAQVHADATYTRLVEKDDGCIDWARPATEIERMVRAYAPWPGAFTTLRGERLVLLSAVAMPAEPSGNPLPGRIARVDTSNGILVETGNGLLALQRLQLQSRKPLDWRSFQNGVHDLPGAVLGGS